MICRGGALAGWLLLVKFEVAGRGALLRSPVAAALGVPLPVLDSAGTTMLFPFAGVFEDVAELLTIGAPKEAVIVCRDILL